jgi:hypothetical protein
MYRGIDNRGICRTLQFRPDYLAGNIIVTGKITVEFPRFISYKTAEKKKE